MINIFNNRLTLFKKNLTNLKKLNIEFGLN